MSDRIHTLNDWLKSLGYQDYSLELASEDASFRQYFRLRQGDKSWIVMDAPPEKESCEEFVHIANKINSVHLSAPQIIHQNLDQGFLVISDFGDQQYLQLLNAETVDSLYGDAISALIKMQQGIDVEDLPPYDESLLRREMDLFKEWFLEKLLGIEMDQMQLGMWQTSNDYLVANALEQPQVFVHRDYHSRNLMKLDQNNPGILDFQDAVKGPITYDLVSLLRDCYIEWPENQVDQWVVEYHQKTRDTLLVGIEIDQLMDWFNLMGVQRHLKAIGIFARLSLRDGKQQFLNDIPRILNYLKIVGTTETSMVGLYTLINELSLGFRIKSLLKK